MFLGRLAPELQTGAKAGDPAQGRLLHFRAIAEGAMALSKFWRKRQAEFEKYQQQFRGLKAHWYVAGQQWRLQYGESPQQLVDVFDVFKAIAQKIVARCPQIRAEIASKPYPRVAVNAEPWEVWLDFMRIRQRGFRVTGHIRCTEYEWDAGVKDGKALNTVRKELKYTSGDEDTNLYQRLPDGSLRQLSTKELKGKRSEDLRKYYQWLEKGTIEHVFESSARFCVVLDGSAYESEKAGRTTRLAGGESQFEGNRHSVDFPDSQPGGRAAERQPDPHIRPRRGRRPDEPYNRAFERAVRETAGQTGDTNTLDLGGLGEWLDDHGVRLANRKPWSACACNDGSTAQACCSWGDVAEHHPAEFTKLLRQKLKWCEQHPEPKS
jgi:hypothetical protein